MRNSNFSQTITDLSPVIHCETALNMPMRLIFYCSILTRAFRLIQSTGTRLKQQAGYFLQEHTLTPSLNFAQSQRTNLRSVNFNFFKKWFNLFDIIMPFMCLNKLFSRIEPDVTSHYADQTIKWMTICFVSCNLRTAHGDNARCHKISQGSSYSTSFLQQIKTLRQTSPELYPLLVEIVSTKEYHIFHKFQRQFYVQMSLWQTILKRIIKLFVQKKNIPWKSNQQSTSRSFHFWKSVSFAVHYHSP